MLLAVFVGVVAALLIAVLVPRAISAFRLWVRARHDHRVTRGTQHLKQLGQPLSALKRDIRATQGEISTIQRKLAQLRSRRQDELKQALSRYLVTHRLTEVDGIGPRLKQRIVRHSFRGNLRDLRHVERVSGVGPTRRRAIMRWVQAREYEFPRLIEGSFPGQEEVQAKYQAKLAPLESRLGDARVELEEKKALHASVSAAVDKLRSVQVSQFRKALATKKPEEAVPNWYLEGVYPAWESPPDWFVTVLSRYGG
jgi:hypothetical protein